MTFFDKKEDVMKIQLTPYGRYLLSIGKLVPHSYKFFDEDILYDTEAIGITEEQNSHHNRITKETPKLISNPNITGVETNIKKFESLNIKIDNIRIPSADDIVSNNNESIGTNPNLNSNCPAFRVEMYRGEFSEVDIKNYYSSNNVDFSPIPQIPINMFLSSSIIKSESNLYTEGADDMGMNSAEFPDGSKFKIAVPEPIIRIYEENSFDEIDNFIITAFKIETVNDVTIFKKLTFPNKEKLIVDDLLVGDLPPPPSDAELFDDFPHDDPAGMGDNGGMLTPYRYESSLSYYLDVIYDKEIPNQDICSTIGELEIRNIFLDEKLGCPDAMDEFDFDIYASNVTDADIEDCE